MGHDAISDDLTGVINSGATCFWWSRRRYSQDLHLNTDLAIDRDLLSLLYQENLFTLGGTIFHDLCAIVSRLTARTDNHVQVCMLTLSQQMIYVSMNTTQV